MSPFMALMLIGFAAVIVLALLVWSILTPTPRRPRRDDAVAERRAATSRPVSNDEVRGAKVRVPERRRGDDDPFERFLHAERDEA